MSKGKIPDRWLPYTSIGQRIPGTRFICFKVPLKDSVFDNMEETIRFTPDMLLNQCPTLQFIVDLTNTNRYYDGKVFSDRGLTYKKIQTPGHVIPGKKYVKEFFDTVDSFLGMPGEADSLIGVHCTHGLNRTSYYVCSYMIHRMNFEPQEAITAFEEARGHKIERPLYVEDLLKRGMGSADVAPVVVRGRQRQGPYDRPRGHPGLQRPQLLLRGPPGHFRPEPLVRGHPRFHRPEHLPRVQRGYHRPGPPPSYFNPYARIPGPTFPCPPKNTDWRSQCVPEAEKFGYGNWQQASYPPPSTSSSEYSSRWDAGSSIGPHRSAGRRDKSRPYGSRPTRPPRDEKTRGRERGNS